MCCSKGSSSATASHTYFNRRAIPNPRSKVKGLTAASGGGDDVPHDAPEAAAAEEEAEAAAGKFAVAVAGAGETAAVAVVVADGCVG